MIHPIEAKTCVEAWLKAVNLLATMPDRCAYNVILDIENPVAMTDRDQRIVKAVDRFLTNHEADPVATVAATIFPASDYRRNGVKGVFEDFPGENVPKAHHEMGHVCGTNAATHGKEWKALQSARSHDREAPRPEQT